MHRTLQILAVRSCCRAHGLGNEALRLTRFCDLRAVSRFQELPCTASLRTKGLYMEATSALAHTDAVGAARATASSDLPLRLPLGDHAIH